MPMTLDELKLIREVLSGFYPSEGWLDKLFEAKKIIQREINLKTLNVITGEHSEDSRRTSE